MNSVIEAEKKQAISRSKKMLKLLDNEDFQELILGAFINDGLKQNVIDGSLDSSATIDELKARQILHRFLYDIITSGENIQTRSN